MKRLNKKIAWLIVITFIWCFTAGNIFADDYSSHYAVSGEDATNTPEGLIASRAQTKKDNSYFGDRYKGNIFGKDDSEFGDLFHSGDGGLLQAQSVVIEPTGGPESQSGEPPLIEPLPLSQIAHDPDAVGGCLDGRCGGDTLTADVNDK